VFRAWNRAAAQCRCTVASKLTPGRRAAIRARIKDHDCQAIVAAIDTIPQSSFLNGGGERGWIADLDSMLRPENMTRLIEGYYHTERNGNGSPPGKPPHDSRDGFERALDRRIFGEGADGPARAAR
jgi:hypothetical protein